MNIEWIAYYVYQMSGSKFWNLSLSLLISVECELFVALDRLVSPSYFFYLFAVIFQRECSTFSFDTHETLARADS